MQLERLTRLQLPVHELAVLCDAETRASFPVPGCLSMGFPVLPEG
jgi:hypothetical protein